MLNPDYTSEDSPRRLLAEVEAKFIEAFGGWRYQNKLTDACIEANDVSPVNDWDIITASALTRATAMAEFLKEKK